jgi:tetratricopeptide (TPR) repeat protein
VQRLHGRADALARARPYLQRAVAGEGGLLLITGEPGIGKSSLAEHLAAEAAGGATVAWGRCWEAGGAPAYWPFIQVWRELQLDGAPFAGADAFAADAEQARFAAFDLAVRRLKEAAAQRPLVLVLDDLHAADVPSLLLLLLLVRQLRTTPLLVVGTYRQAELRLHPAVAALLMKVAREGEVLPLERLDLEACAAWVRERWPAASGAQIAELHRLTEGHPLFLGEALRLGSGAQAQQRMLEGLGAVLDERLAHLAPATHAALQVAAVLGREFSAADLAATAELPMDDADRAIREAGAASIVETVVDAAPAAAAPRFRFAHVLLRDRLYAELAPSRRAALHWRAGLQAHDPSQAAHHLFAGASAGEPTRLAEVALAAAEAALARLAFEEAAHLAERALQLPGQAPRVVCHLKVIAGEAAIRLGQDAAGKRLCEEAAALEDPELRVRAALVYGTNLTSGTVDPTMVALLRQALAHLGPGDSPQRARVTARLASALSPPGSAETSAEMRALARESVAMARRLHDPHTLLHVLPFVATSAGFVAAEDERFPLIEETVALARSLDARMVLLHTLPAYVTALVARGARAEVAAALASYDQLSAAFPQPQQHWRGRLLHALVSLVRGDFAEAERLNGEARTLAEAAGTHAGTNLWMFQRFAMAHLRRQPELAVGVVDELAAQFAAWHSTVPMAAWLAAATGAHADATARLDALALDPQNFVGLCAAGDTCVLLQDAARGQRIYPRLAALADRASGFSAMAPGSLMGPLGRTLGDLARLVGRPDEAAGHYQRAIADCERLGASWLAEQCRKACADVPPVPRPTTPRLELRREGDVWAVTPGEGPPFRLKHGKGLAYLSCLLEQPGREVHVLELLGIEQAGDAGPVLDAQAKQAYRRRIDDLREQLAEAEHFSDPARARRLQDELDAIAEQLAGAVGLGGRDRVAASDVERARINVQRRLRVALAHIAAANPALGRYLAAAIRTGTTCCYQPL